jgi:hypothetical protein
MLYDIVEDFGSLIFKIEYQLRVNQAYMDKLLEEVTNDDRERLNLIDGMEVSNRQIIEELRAISARLTNTMRK